ncbi:hypothetical protein EG327_003451 [Venturia inaequalis]|uniref:GH16 domain-containing protein n=1 Tax=Venturia inaequalis TaxID=5025 RepID=A0A8H3VIS9_VENIN|nr:hypothetical protein EG327_003451 [Venturia inaequalis]
MNRSASRQSDNTITTNTKTAHRKLNFNSSVNHRITESIQVVWSSKVSPVLRSTFFDKFDFFTDDDPTAGYVDYKSRADARSLGLISTTATSAKWGVGGGVLNPDDTTIRGRASVRLEGKVSYTKGLFVADIAHMPGNACGIWPAFWTLGSGSWPLNGEIDIIENVNEITRNKVSLHTGSTACAINKVPMQGSIVASDCRTLHNGVIDNSVGCSVDSGSNADFGDPFNAGNGGTYAMQWTDTFIKTWFFPRGSEPKSLSCSAPDVTEFGTPDSFFSGCDIASNFKEHRIVFTTTFCGSWAGADGILGGQFYQGLQGDYNATYMCFFRLFLVHGIKHTSQDVFVLIIQLIFVFNLVHLPRLIIYVKRQFLVRYYVVVE